MKSTTKLFLIVKPYWKRLAVAALCSFAVSGFNGTLAWLVKPAVDKVFVERNATFLLLLSFSIMAAFLGRGIFEFFHSYLMGSVGAKIVRDIRNKIYHHMLYVPMSFIHRDSTGAMVSRAMNDAGVVQGLLSHTVKDVFVEGGTAIALIGVALSRRWDLTILSLVVLPVAFYFVGRFGKKLKRVSDHTQEKISLLTEMLTEGFSGSKIIKSFSRQEHEIERFKDCNQGYYRELMRSTRIHQATTLMMEFVSGIGIAFVLWYGGNLVIQGAITAGDFFSFLAAIFLVYTPARRLTVAYNMLQQAKAPLERIENFLAEAREKDGSMPIRKFDNEIVFDNVSFRYGGTDSDALNGVSLTVRKGEIVALVGRSGAGKTTLADLVPRFNIPGEGKILIDGMDISEATLESLRSLIGIVSQDIILFNDTVRANIAYGKAGATEEEIINAAKAAYAHDFILELPQGYETAIGERGIRLSGGQKQRLSIARAILKNPPILILDEATSSLDTASERMVQMAMENLMADRTAFVIAHRLSTVRRANRILVLERGRITESGTHEELLERGGIYRKLYNMQFEDTQSEQDEGSGLPPPAAQCF